MGKHPEKPLKSAPVFLGVASILFVTCLFGSASATAEGDHDHSDLEHHERYTGPGTRANWPPRPVGAIRATQRVPGPPSHATLGRPGSTRSISSKRAVAAQLGDDWIFLSEEPARQSKNGFTGAQYTFFSRDRNHTVIVIKDKGGNLDVTTWAAAELQPVVTDSESAEAVELGRIWLMANGFSEVLNLEGFSIRALNDGALYNVRMVYVTFATEAFADPTHSALVDMTNLSAISGRAL